MSNRLHELWGETWKPRLAPGEQAGMEVYDRVTLDARQPALLEGMAGNDQLLVDIGAGTGKC